MDRVPNSRRLPSPAIVLASLAALVALGSTALAVVPAPKTISGTKIAKRSEPGNRFVPNSITGKEVNESKLGKLPSAVSADEATSATHATSATSATSAGDASNVGGATAASLTVKCPTGTTLVQGGCMENGAARAAQTYVTASRTCGALGGTLPSVAQLSVSFVVNSGVEMTADLVNATPAFFTYDFGTGTISSTSAATAFRCVFPLSN